EIKLADEARMKFCAPGFSNVVVGFQHHAAATDFGSLLAAFDNQFASLLTFKTQFSFPITCGPKLREKLSSRQRVDSLEQIMDIAAHGFGAGKAVQPLTTVIPLDDPFLEIPDDDRLER